MEYRYHATDRENLILAVSTMLEIMASSFPVWAVLFAAAAWVYQDLLVLIIAFLVFGSVVMIPGSLRIYQERKMTDRESCFRIESGCIVSTAKAGWDCFPCRYIRRIARRGRNYVIVVRLPERPRARILYLIPFRVIGDKKDRDRFVQMIRQQRIQTSQEAERQVQCFMDKLDREFAGDRESDYTLEWSWEKKELQRARKRLKWTMMEHQTSCHWAGFERLGMERWRLRFREDGILIRCYINELLIQWKNVTAVLETPEWVLIYGAKGGAGTFFPRKLLGDQEERAEFFRYCEKHGLKHQTEPAVQRGQFRKMLRVKPVRIFLAGIMVYVGVNMLFTGLWLSMQKKKKKEKAQMEAQFSFHPEDYPDYQPLDQQIVVLQDLGLQIPPEVIANRKEAMEEWPESRVWIEGYPYAAILSELGSPKRDKETGKITEYSGQAYWFDWEGADLSTDYTEILNGVNALSGQEFSLTGAAEDMSRVDWEQGTGVVTVSFLLNGTLYSMELEVEYDWLDAGILSSINEALAKEQAPGRVYAMDDNGQGCILFYRDAQWAEEFGQKTGIELVTEYR